MGKKKKIEIIGTPRWQGRSLHVRVIFNYEERSRELSFNIPRQHAATQADLIEELKKLYEENMPVTKDYDVPTEIDW